MTIALQEFLNYSLNAPKYHDGLVFVQSGTDEKDVTAMNMWLRRYCQKHKGLSFMLVSSSTDSKDGTAAGPHIHGLLINEEPREKIEEARKSFTKYCQKRRKKRPGLKQQQTKLLNGMSIVQYMDRQCDSERTYGDFDFDYFKDARYVDVF